MSHEILPFERVLARFVMEQASDAIFVLDDEGRTEVANRTAREMFPEHWGVLFTAGGPYPEELRSFRARPWADDRIERELVHAEVPGQPRALQMKGDIVDGHHVVVVRDVTALRAAEDELRHLRRVESAGLLSLSAVHDLGNLLTPILYLAQGLAEGTLGGCWEPGVVAREIAEAADRATELTRRILSFGRSSLPASNGVNANDVVRAMSSLVEGMLRSEIRLELDLDDRLEQIVVDRGRLEHVILNLVANARDAMPLGGALTVRTQNVTLEPQRSRAVGAAARGPFIAISVADTGSGIRPDLVDRVFDRFFTTKDARAGTGLGLAMARSFVMEAEGLITVQSDEGKGTVVTLYLPRTG